MKTLMLTATGSASAISLVYGFHRAGCRVVGCDLYPREWNAASLALDAFIQVPPASRREAYLEQLHTFCREQAVELLLPLTDVECDLLCSLGGDFAPCIIATQPEPVQSLCRDKRRMAAFLREKELCDTIPDTDPYSHTPAPEDYPLVLKPNGGRSSEGRIIVHSPEEFAFALKQRDDYILQPFLEGNIFTAEIARDRLGHCWVTLREELLRTANGLGTTVKLWPGHPLEECCERIAAACGIIGVVNMEFIHHGERYYFLEVNPRFSGGVGFPMAAGIDYAAAELLILQGENLPPRPGYPSAVLTRAIHPVVGCALHS